MTLGNRRLHLTKESDIFRLLLRRDRFRLGCKIILLDKPYSLVAKSLKYVKGPWFDSTCGCIIIP